MMFLSPYLYKCNVHDRGMTLLSLILEDLKNIKWVLLRLSDSLFRDNQVESFSSNYIIKYLGPCVILANLYCQQRVSKILVLSCFVYIKNNRGPKKEPWGTPQDISFLSDIYYILHTSNAWLYHF